MDLRHMFGCLTSFTVVCLALEAGVEVTLNEENVDMAPLIGQRVNQSGVRLRRAPRPTESSEVQDYIDRHFTHRKSNQRLSSPTQSVFIKAPSCQARGYCFLEDDGSLDDDTAVRVDDLLNSRMEFVKYYNITDKLSEEDEVGSRYDPDNPNAEGLCKSETALKTPTWLLTDEDKWEKIAQSRNFVQRIRVEICKFENCPCEKRLVTSLRSRFVTRCKQKHIYRELVILSENGTQLSTQRFRMPSCCTCLVYKEQRGDKKYAEECKRVMKEVGGAGSRDRDEDEEPCSPQSSGSRPGQGLVLFLAAVYTLYFHTSSRMPQL